MTPNTEDVFVFRSRDLCCAATRLNDVAPCSNVAVWHPGGYACKKLSLLDFPGGPELGLVKATTE